MEALLHIILKSTIIRYEKFNILVNDSLLTGITFFGLAH